MPHAIVLERGIPILAEGIRRGQDGGHGKEVRRGGKVLTCPTKVLVQVVANKPNVA